MKYLFPQLRDSLERIYQKQKTAEQNAEQINVGVHQEQKQSITNLLLYLVLRLEDLRFMQDNLHNAGLSSLASAERHILRQV